MNNRYFKIFMCVLMVCCLLFSFTFSAYAAVPITIGELPGIAGALGALVAGIMGVNYSYSDISAQALDNFADYQSTLNYALWLQGTKDGKALLNIGYDALQALGLISADKIDALSIADYSSGSAYSAQVTEFNGYEFFQDGNYIRTNNLGPSVTIPKSSQWEIGSTYVVSANNTSDGTVHITKSTSNRLDFEFYYKGVLCGTLTSSPYNIVLHRVVRYYLFGDKVYLCLADPASNYDSHRGGSIGSAEIKNEQINYNSQVVDTSILNNLPITAGLQVSIPATGLETTAQLAQMMVEGILENDPNITAQVVQDAGKPIVYDQTISETPYNVLDRALDNIRSSIGSIASSVTGTISSSLTGIQEAVNSIAGSIETADASFAQSFIDGFLDVFRIAFDGVSSHLGIWHYVVSWIGSISSCFSWCLSAVSSAGSIFLAPIYAMFAGTVVIAVYRRFGK